MNTPTVLPSESASGPYTACVWYSGLYVARALNPSIPGTKSEMLALAALGGMPNGESGNFTLLAQAMKSRYGLIGQVTDHLGSTAAYNAVMAAASAGPVAVALAGDGYNLSPRYQSNHFGHAIAVLYDSGTTGRQFDPLAPPGYTGDAFGPAELAAFATAAIIFKETPSVATITVHFAPGTYDGYQFNDDGSTAAIKSGTIGAGGSSAPASLRSKIVARDGYFYYITAGIWQGYWVKESASVFDDAHAPAPPPPPPPPAPKIYSQAELDAAVAAVPQKISQAQLDKAVEDATATGRAAGIKAAQDELADLT